MIPEANHVPQQTTAVMWQGITLSGHRRCPEGLVCVCTGLEMPVLYVPRSIFYVQGSILYVEESILYVLGSNSDVPRSNPDVPRSNSDVGRSNLDVLDELITALRR